MRHAVAKVLYHGQYASSEYYDCATITSAWTTADIRNIRAPAYPQTRYGSGQVLAVFFIKLPNGVTYLLENSATRAIYTGESINEAVFALTHM